MPDKFDPYREALVVETQTIWPAELTDLDEVTKRNVERALHTDPESAANLQYTRLHSGFCREITVTEDDINRVSGS